MNVNLSLVIFCSLVQDRRSTASADFCSRERKFHR